MTKNIQENAMNDEIIDNLVKHILSLNVDLKSRRYDEEIQTDDVKEQWLRKTLKNDPALFLEKWGKHLRPSDLDYFDPLNDDYEIAFHLKALKKNNQTKNSQKSNNNSHHGDNMNELTCSKIIRNRRYNYVQRHPEYFTIENLQERNPYEYEEYIGQYIPEDKRVEFQPFQKDMSLVERMYFDIDHQRMNDEIEEMEDILYQEEEKEKEEEKKEEELFKKLEKEKTKKEESEESESDSNENSTPTAAAAINESLLTDNKGINDDKDKEIEQSLETSLRNIDINEEDILKLTDKNQKFYQSMNALEDEEDFVEEEDDSDEEYNEETIMKEVERRRELKRKEQELKKKEKESSSPFSSLSFINNDTRGSSRTKIRIANPTYFDKKLESDRSNNNETKKSDNSRNNDSNKKNEKETIPSEPAKPIIPSVKDIFNVKEDDDDDDEKKSMERPQGEENNYDEEDEEISEELKQYYYNEFINIMKKEFIDGHDKNFDYSLVDNCEEYDDIQLYEQDMHELYFEDNEDLFYSDRQNLQKRYYDNQTYHDEEDDEDLFFDEHDF